MKGLTAPTKLRDGSGVGYLDALEKWVCDASSVADVEAKGRGQRVRGHAACWPIA